MFVRWSPGSVFAGMPPLIRFLGGHLAFGAAVGVAIASAMVWTNAAGLNDLFNGDGHPYLALFVFVFMFALTFASVAMAAGIMTIPDKQGPDSIKRSPDWGTDSHDRPARDD